MQDNGMTQSLIESPQDRRPLAMKSAKHFARTIFNRTRGSLNATLNTLVRKQHVAMLHIGRCGSSVLGDMLNQHPMMFWAGEIFEPHWKSRQPPPPHFVERTIHTSRCDEVSRMYGFETKYLPHMHLSQTCINMALKDYIRFLRHLNFTKFIVLHRENYLRRLISTEIFLKTKKAGFRREVTTPTKIVIDINGLTWRKPILETFQLVDDSYEAAKKLLPSDEALFLTYERDILEDPRTGYRKACQFVGMDDAHPQVNLKRANPFSYEQLVENIDDVRAALQSTKYAWMLDE